MQSLAEWKFGSGNVRDKKKKQKVDYEPHRPTATRLKIEVIIQLQTFKGFTCKYESCKMEVDYCHYFVKGAHICDVDYGKNPFRNSAFKTCLTS